MREVLAYFLTWTTYGTWLPGDSRGWVSRHRQGGEIVAPPSLTLEWNARRLMKEVPVVLDTPQRRVADTAIRQACDELGWTIHALNVRSNHVHAVVTASDSSPGKVMGVLKVSATRALNGRRVGGGREHWWTREGSKRLLNTPGSVQAAIRYVIDQE